jgi:hypothetical protein
MSDIIKRLGELNVAKDAFVTLNYTEGADVWHINENHVEESVAETSTAAMLAGLLTSGLAVSDTYGDGDILAEMRGNGALDDYDRGDFAFEDYLTQVLVDTIYEGEYALAYSTTQYDYKRGRCDISTAVRVRVADLATYVNADSLVSGFDVSVQTDAGTLTLS